MAFTDSLLQLSNAQALNSTTAASTSIYDVTGAGAGNAPNQKFGTSTNFGADISVGRTMYAWFVVTTAFVLASSTPSLTIQVQAAPSSSNNPGTYVTLAASQAFSAAQLVLGATIILPIPPMAPIAPSEVLPRFYRFNYLIATSTFSAGAISGFISLEPPTGLVSTLYPANFVSGL